MQVGNGEVSLGCFLQVVLAMEEQATIGFSHVGGHLHLLVMGRGVCGGCAAFMFLKPRGYWQFGEETVVVWWMPKETWLLASYGRWLVHDILREVVLLLF